MNGHAAIVRNASELDTEAFPVGGDSEADWRKLDGILSSEYRPNIDARLHTGCEQLRLTQSSKLI